MSAGQPITVLHFVAANQDRGGILTVVRALAERCQERAIVWVATGFAQERRPTLRLLRRDTLPAEEINPRTLWLAACDAWRLRLALNEKRRVFHGHSRAGLLVGLWLWLLGSDRVIVSVHNHGRHRWFYRWAAVLLGERLIWLTPAMKRHYDVGTGGWRGCVPNFLPVASTQPRRVLRSEKLRLGGVGSLVAWKNWMLVLEALALLAPTERTLVEFHHVGSSDDSLASELYARNLRARANELGLSASIFWRGEEPSSEKLLAACDVLILPAETEPFGLGVLEAWRAGIPVLVASGSGAAELIHSDADGWTFTAKSPGALAEKISWLLRTRADQLTRPRLPDAEPIISGWARRYLAAAGEESNLI